ncbi:MAG: hypothetical protein KDD55_04175, partial [Bdellovibrionales bacterium]|nr:hypothetical protein [Bdellovibrionales bacterium]
MKLLVLFIGFLFFCVSELSQAQDIDVSGHFKYQPSVSWTKQNSLQRFFGKDTLHSQEFDIRENVQSESGPFTFDIQGEFLGLGGTSYSTLEKQSLFLGQDLSLLPDDDTQLFDLSTRALDDNNFAAVARLDRLSLRYTTDQTVIKIGRQAVSFGNGLAFHVLDLFTPFSPLAIDKDYKTGADLLYAQYLFSGGSDIEGVIVPRRSLETGDIEHNVSSYALHYHTPLPSLGGELSTLVTQHYNNWNFGSGLTLNIGEALWRGDVLVERTAENETVFSLVTNIDRSWILSGHNIYTYIEYYRNGLGRSHRDYSLSPSELTGKISRGELFVLGRDFLAAGVQIEFMPLWNMFFNQIFHANDGSGYSQIRSEHDLYQDITLMIGTNIP